MPSTGPELLSAANRPPVQVAVGVLADAAGRVLLSRRAADSHQGGLWEFPGGKREPGESLQQALARELDEELGVRVERSRPLIRVLHHYPGRSVLLDVHRVSAWSGRPQGREGQPLRWVDPEAMSEFEFPAADRPIISALRLPEHYLITGPDPSQAVAFLQRLERALERGIRLVQLRAPGLKAASYRALGRDALACCRSFGARLLLNAEPELALALGADGAHLNSRRLALAQARLLPSELWIAASCHTPEQLARAEALGLDFVVLSPVRATPSHPGAQPLGWERFRTLVEPAALPVFALGGMRHSDLALAQQSGAQGIAAIGALWGE